MILYKELKFDEAFSYFEKSDVDPRILIDSLYMIKPKESTFVTDDSLKITHLSMFFPILVGGISRVTFSNKYWIFSFGKF